MKSETRTLPPAKSLAAELAVDGSVVEVATGDFPAFAVSVDGHHLALFRELPHAVSLSIDEKPFWIAFPEDWQSGLSEIRAALREASRRTARVRLSEIVVACAGFLERATGSRWQVTFPGTPVPAEVSLTLDEAHVGVFQSDDAVRVVVWVGGVHHQQVVDAHAQLPALGTWLGARLSEQAHALAATRAEEQRKRATPGTSLSEVLRGLKLGKAFRTGGGRAWTKYFWDGTTLRAEHFDEGSSWTESIAEAELASAVAHYPEAFGA